MTMSARGGASSRSSEPSGPDALAEFAVLVARSSLGTQEALDSRRHGQELRERDEASDVHAPAIPPDAMFAAAQHLQALEFHDSAELAYRTAATSGSTAAAVALADLLDHHGRVEEARLWTERAWQRGDGRAGLRIAVEKWIAGRNDEAEEVLDKVVADRQHELTADVTGAELLVREGKVRDALLVGWQPAGLARAVVYRLAATTLQNLEVQYERIDPSSRGAALVTPSEWDDFPPGSPLWWRPPGSPVIYRLRARWREGTAPSFVPEAVRSEILFVVANACFSAGGLIDWGKRELLPTEDRHSMTVPRFFDEVSRQCPPVDREVAASLAELAEVDVGIRITRSFLSEARGVKGLPGQVAEKTVLGRRREQIITRVRRLADTGRLLSLDNSTAPVARRVGFDVQSTRTVLAQVREEHGRKVRSISDRHIQHLCAVRGSRNTTKLFAHVVRLSGGDESEFRDLIQTVLGYLDVLLLFRTSQPL